MLSRRARRWGREAAGITSLTAPLVRAQQLAASTLQLSWAYLALGMDGYTASLGAIDISSLFLSLSLFLLQKFSCLTECQILWGSGTYHGPSSFFSSLIASKKKYVENDGQGQICGPSYLSPTPSFPLAEPCILATCTLPARKSLPFHISPAAAAAAQRCGTLDASSRCLAERGSWLARPERL